MAAAPPSTLYYAHDPMCSWCWGFAPTWRRVRERLPVGVRVRRLLGGLAPDTETPMPAEMRRHLQATWKRIQERIPGTEFNFDFWRLCEPRRATWRACRAVIAARFQDPAVEEPMIARIQSAYYLEARNPSDAPVLGRLAADLDCHVQTHCSESDWQHAYVLERHGMKDTDSLDRFGLLTDKTILAHGILIDEADMTTIRRRRSGIAHCPLSNLYLSHAVFPARRALDSGLKIGLGTDIAGGPSASILHNCQQAVNVSRALEDGVDGRRPAAERGTPGSRINFREAFWMATVGGAKVLNLPIGRFEAGYAFDALLVDTQIRDSNLVVWGGLDSADDVLQKIVNNADRQDIREVWVQGRAVKTPL